MKKFVLVFVAFALALSMVLAGFTPAQAAVKWGDPTVTPITGDTDFTVTLLDPSKVGSFKGNKGLTIPEGFVDGEKQFGGKILVLKGASYGSQTLCFPFPTYQYGWRGSIASWNGSKWVKLATSFTPAKESAPTMACTTIYGNGSYGLIVGYDKNAIEGPKVCDYEIGWDFYPDDGGWWYTVLYLPPWLEGKYVSYVIDMIPSGFSGPGIADGGIVECTLGCYFHSDEPFSVVGGIYDYWYIKITTPDCYIYERYNYNDDER